MPRSFSSIRLIGAPTDVGAGHRGGSMGPEALRVAGLTQALELLGQKVQDSGNLAGPVNPNAQPAGGYRHLAEIAEWCRLVRDAVEGALDDGDLPIVLGGDHSMAIGSIAGVAKHCRRAEKRLSVIWFDAHADFNTPETSASGNIHGMPVAILAGHGPAELVGLAGEVPAVDAGAIVQIGIRSVDRMEKSLVVENGLIVHDMREIDERGMRAVMEDAIAEAAARGDHVHVSFDIDFMDPAVAPGVGTTVPGGPTYREAQLCMEMIYDAGIMGSLDLVELNPAYDIRNRSAELVVEMVESLFGEQILSRHRSNI